MLQIFAARRSPSSSAPGGICQRCPSRHPLATQDTQEEEIKLTHKQEEGEELSNPLNPFFFFLEANSLLIKPIKN